MYTFLAYDIHGIFPPVDYRILGQMYLDLNIHINNLTDRRVNRRPSRRLKPPGRFGPEVAIQYTIPACRQLL